MLKQSISITLLNLLLLATSVESSSSVVSRRIEQEYNGATSMQYGKCFRLKIREDNDGDEEGNSYFYNGAYRAQYVRYASFYLCGEKGNCDESIEYVMEMQEYLEYSSANVVDYCGACSSTCNRRLRSLEEDGSGDDEGEDEGDAAEEAYWQVTCATCSKQCKNYLNGGEGNDETQYIECQYAFEEDGVAYYSGPQCGNDQNILIGLFYDDECTIKSDTEYDYGFSYNTFQAIEDVQVECGGGACEQMIEEAAVCSNGFSMNGDNDDSNICKAAKKAAKREYAAKPWYKRKKMHLTAAAIALVVVIGSFLFFSYTYYIRHKCIKKTPLADQDHVPGSKSADLPAIS